MKAQALAQAREFPTVNHHNATSHFVAKPESPNTNELKRRSDVVWALAKLFLKKKNLCELTYFFVF